MNQAYIPLCSIPGVRIAAIDMKKVLTYIRENLSGLEEKYIFISNVYTIVISYKDSECHKIQNKATDALKLLREMLEVRYPGILAVEMY